MRLLIGYDGSAGADGAISAVGGLFPGATATVLTVWDGLAQISARGIAPSQSALDFEAIDAAGEQAAVALAQEGAARARRAGLVAEPETVKRDATVWEAIVRRADADRAAVVVLGSRGASPSSRLVLGSVSRGVLAHADRPVLVIPAPDATQPADGEARSAEGERR